MDDQSGRQTLPLDEADASVIPDLDDELEGELSSLDIILEAARKRIDEQNVLIGTLDTKAGFVLGSASLLTAGVAAFERTAFDVAARLSMTNQRLDEPSRNTVLVIAGIALLFYLGIFIFGFLAYKLRKYESLTEIGMLRQLYVAETEATTKLVILDTMDRAIKLNDPQIKKKALWTQISVILLVIEAGLIALLLFIQLVFLNWGMI